MARAKKSPDSDVMDLATKLKAKLGNLSVIVPGKQDPRSEIRTVCPTGIDVFDHYVLGCGGGPAGRVTELFCDEGGGKTTLTWTWLGYATRHNGIAVYCDAEDSYDSERAALFGLDQNRTILLQPWTLEDALQQLMTALETIQPKNGQLVMAALDSVAGAQFAGDMNGKFTKEAADDRSKKLGKFIRQAQKIAVKKQIHLLMVNQTRELRGVMYGNKTTTPGGKPIKFAASHRIQMFPGKALKNAVGQHVGKAITMLAVKNRFAPPYRKAKVRIDYMNGWDNVWSTMNLAKDLKLIPAALKPTPENYARAVEAFGWKTFAPFKELVTADAVEEGESEQEKELDMWAAGDGPKKAAAESEDPEDDDTDDKDAA